MGANTVYAAVAALSVDISSVTPTVSGVTAALRTVEAADLPKRVIALAIGQDSQTARALTIGTSPLLQVSYTVKDLLLWKMVGMGEATAQDDNDLLDYADAWIAKYQTNRAIATRVSWTDVTASPGVYTFGGVDYLGCEITLLLSELRS